LVVDEAHGAGFHRPGSHGMVTVLGLEGRVLVRLYTFNKALAASGSCNIRALRSPQMRIEHINNKCLHLLSTSFLFTRDVRRGWMITGLSWFPPSSLVHALRTIGYVQHQSVPSPNTLLPLAYKYRAHSLEDIPPREGALLIISISFDLVSTSVVSIRLFVTSCHVTDLYARREECDPPFFVLAMSSVAFNLPWFSCHGIISLLDDFGYVNWCKLAVRLVVLFRSRRMIHQRRCMLKFVPCEHRPSLVTYMQLTPSLAIVSITSGKP
jgi:hypothetical protein